jgi:hypothetical protein
LGWVVLMMYTHANIEMFYDRNKLILICNMKLAQSAHLQYSPSASCVACMPDEENNKNYQAITWADKKTQ